MSKDMLVIYIVMAIFAITKVYADGTSVLSSSSSEVCKAKRALCVPATADCDGDFIFNEHLCRTSNMSVACCQYPMYCINGTCKENNNLEECSDDSDCVTSFYGTGIHKCINNTCQMLFNANDYCTNSSECADDMKCENGRCKGYALNHECTPPVSPGVRPALFGLTHYVCGEGLVCAPHQEQGKEHHRCIYGGNESDVCNKTHPCNINLVCNKGKCVKPFSVLLGEECDNAQACTCLNGTCIQPTNYKFVECESNDDCKEGTDGICNECNHLTGQRSCGVPNTVDYCSKEWKAAYACYERKKCAPVPGFVMYSCVQEQCSTETNDLLSCRMNCDKYRGDFKDCASNLIMRNCPTFPMWARIVTAFTILCTAVLIIFIVYGVSIVMTKKKYSHLNSS